MLWSDPLDAAPRCRLRYSELSDHQMNCPALLAALTALGIALHVAAAPQAWSRAVGEIKAPSPPTMPPEPPHGV